MWRGRVRKEMRYVRREGAGRSEVCEEGGCEKVKCDVRYIVQLYVRREDVRK